VLTKSKSALIASALALAAAGGAVAVIRVASAGSENVASAALPVPIGSAATARVPSTDPGSADGVGGATSGATGTATGAAGDDSGQTSPGTTGNTTAPGQTPREPTLSAAAGQGDQGPLPAGALPADGAVPGAAAALRAMAASRAATSALPHSPQLLSELAGSGGWAADAATPSPSSTGDSASATASATPAATATAPGESATATPAVPAASAAAPMGGIDVAAYQHPDTGQYPNGVPINWAKVAAAGYRFAAVKGTEGDYYVNRWAATDLAEAKAAGLDVSPYHFAIPNVSSGQAQAEYAVEYSGYSDGAQMMPLMLDIEYDPYVSTDGTNMCYGLSSTKMTTWIAGFVSTVKSLTGQYPIIYTTANWWDTCTDSTAFGADPMWVAAYGFSSPPLPAGWSTWSYWQYTSSGTVPGVDSPGTTDLDSFSPTAIGLINPGNLASRPLSPVSVPIKSLAAMSGQQLTWTAAGLPPGVRVTSGGVLSGTVSTGSALRSMLYKATVTAKNVLGAKSTVTFEWQVAASCPQSLSLGFCPE